MDHQDSKKIDLQKKSRTYQWKGILHVVVITEIKHFFRFLFHRYPIVFREKIILVSVIISPEVFIIISAPVGMFKIGLFEVGSVLSIVDSH